MLGAIVRDPCRRSLTALSTKRSGWRLEIVIAGATAHAHESDDREHNFSAQRGASRYEEHPKRKRANGNGRTETHL